MHPGQSDAPLGYACDDVRCGARRGAGCRAARRKARAASSIRSATARRFAPATSAGAAPIAAACRAIAAASAASCAVSCKGLGGGTLPEAALRLGRRQLSPLEFFDQALANSACADGGEERCDRRADGHERSGARRVADGGADAGHDGRPEQRRKQRDDQQAGELVRRLIGRAVTGDGGRVCSRRAAWRLTPARSDLIRRR